MKHFVLLLAFLFCCDLQAEEIVIDSPEALQKAEERADNNDTEAAVRVGEFYLFGPTAYQNHDRALELITKASKRGHLEAIEILAGMYLNGRGVEQDTAMAAQLYKQCAHQGYGPCQFNLGLIYKKGRPDVPKNPKLAYYWLYKAALNQCGIGDLIYDAAAFRNEVSGLLTHEERMTIVDQLNAEGGALLCDE